MEFKIEVEETKKVNKTISPKFNVGEIVSYTYDDGDEIIISAIIAISVKDGNISYLVYDNDCGTEWFNEDGVNYIK